MEEQEEQDDGDQMTATIKEQAASWNSQNCVYGVNQYGSVFHADDKTQKKQEAFYLKESFEPVMELENVKEIQTQKLVCIKNGVSRELTAGVDYETCEVEKENGWEEICVPHQKRNISGRRNLFCHDFYDGSGRKHFGYKEECGYPVVCH